MAAQDSGDGIGDYLLSCRIVKILGMGCLRGTWAPNFNDVISYRDFNIIST